MCKSHIRAQENKAKKQIKNTAFSRSNLERYGFNYPVVPADCVLADGFVPHYL